MSKKKGLIEALLAQAQITIVILTPEQLKVQEALHKRLFSCKMEAGPAFNVCKRTIR